MHLASCVLRLASCHGSSCPGSIGRSSSPIAGTTCPGLSASEWCVPRPSGACFTPYGRRKGGRNKGQPCLACLPQHVVCTYALGRQVRLVQRRGSTGAMYHISMTRTDYLAVVGCPSCPGALQVCGGLGVLCPLRQTNQAKKKSSDSETTVRPASTLTDAHLLIQGLQTTRAGQLIGPSERGERYVVI